MYRHLLVAMDGSRLAERALGPALEIALRFDAQTTFLRVARLQPEPVILAPGINLNGLESAEASADVEMLEAEAYVDSVQRQWTGLGIPTDRQVTRGDPAEMILATAAAVQADLIVMTTHGRTGFDRILYGSVAESVLRRSPIPVLMIPARPPAQRTARAA